MKSKREFLIENIDKIIKSIKNSTATYICKAIEYNLDLTNIEKVYLFTKFRAKLRKIGISKLNKIYDGYILNNTSLTSNNFYCTIEKAFSEDTFITYSNCIFRTNEARIKFLTDWKQDLINGRKKD